MGASCLEASVFLQEAIVYILYDRHWRTLIGVDTHTLKLDPNPEARTHRNLRVMAQVKLSYKQSALWTARYQRVNGILTVSRID